MIHTECWDTYAAAEGKKRDTLRCPSCRVTVSGAFRLEAERGLGITDVLSEHSDDEEADKTVSEDETVPPPDAQRESRSSIAAYFAPARAAAPGSSTDATVLSVPPPAASPPAPAVPCLESPQTVIPPATQEVAAAPSPYPISMKFPLD